MNNSSTIIPDAPCNNIEQDLFDRKPLADMIAASIRDTIKGNHDSISYGIYGQWGEGKSSLMNFVANVLEGDRNESIRVVRFNPWLVGNDGAVVKLFFQTLSHSVLDIISEKFIKYSSAIAFLSKSIFKGIGYFLPQAEPFADAAGNTMSNAINECADALRSLEDDLLEQKESISEELTKSKKHIVVFIDDLDRLDKEELHTVFRLVRQVADFKNVIYVVAMDPEMVAKLLANSYGVGTVEDGLRFVEKIIQIPIVLPLISEATIAKLLTNHLVGLINPKDEKERSLIEGACIEGARLIKTYRQVIRITNQLRFVLPSIREEVCLYDLILLEILKQCQPIIVSRIYKQKAAILRTGDGIFSIEEKERTAEIEKAFQQAIGSIIADFEDSSSDIKTTLQTLFPEIKRGEIDEKLDEKRICAAVYFPIYFMQQIPGGMIPYREIQLFAERLTQLGQSESILTINEWFERYDIPEIERAILRAVRYTSNIADYAERASKLVYALSLSKIADTFDKSYRISQTDITLFIVHVLFDTYVVKKNNSSDDYVWSKDEKTISTLLSKIYETANIDFCLHLQEQLCYKRFFPSDDSPYLTPLIARYQKIPIAERQSYSRILQQAVLYSWKKQDPLAVAKHLNKLYNTKDFDTFLFVKSLTEQPGREDIQLFISIIKGTYKNLLNALKKRGYTRENSDLINAIACNIKEDEEDLAEQIINNS